MNLVIISNRILIEGLKLDWKIMFFLPKYVVVLLPLFLLRQCDVMATYCSLPAELSFIDIIIRFYYINYILQILDEKPIHTLSMSGMGTLPGPPLAGLASLGLGPPPQKDWDQMSMYSQRTDRSVPRARMYHAGK